MPLFFPVFLDSLYIDPPALTVISFIFLIFSWPFFLGYKPLGAAPVSKALPQRIGDYLPFSLFRFKRPRFSTLFP